eukprot:scaffold8459_cov121-Isochrysis_galbana.AAC.9
MNHEHHRSARTRTLHWLSLLGTTHQHDPMYHLSLCSGAAPTVHPGLTAAPRLEYSERRIDAGALGRRLLIPAPMLHELHTRRLDLGCKGFSHTLQRHSGRRSKCQRQQGLSRGASTRSSWPKGANENSQMGVPAVAACCCMTVTCHHPS